MYRGVLHGGSIIIRNEGFKGLLRGMNCAVGVPYRAGVQDSFLRSTSIK